MTLQIPGSLQWLAYLTGSEWPKGDESAMFRIGEYWHESANELTSLIPELDQVRGETTTVLSGATADAAADNFRLLFDGDYSVDKLADAMSALGDLAKNAGTQIEYTKLQIITSLAIAGAEIAYAIACAPFTFGESLSWIPPIEALTMAAVRLSVSQLLKRLAAALADALTLTAVKKLMKKVVEEAVEETVESLLQEVTIQEIQKGEGHRSGIDWNQVESNAIGGAAGGAGGGATHGPLKHALGDASSVVGKAAKGALTGYGSGIVGNILGSVASDGGLTAGGLDPLSIFGGASTQAISGAIHGTGHPAAEPAERPDLPADADITPSDAKTDPKIFTDSDASSLPEETDHAGAPEDAEPPPTYSADSPPAYSPEEAGGPAQSAPATGASVLASSQGEGNNGATSNGFGPNGSSTNGATTSGAATSGTSNSGETNGATKIGSGINGSGTNGLAAHGVNAPQAAPMSGVGASSSGGVTGPVASTSSAPAASTSTGVGASQASSSSTGSAVGSPDSRPADNAGQSSTPRPSPTPDGPDAGRGRGVDGQAAATRSVAVSPRTADTSQQSAAPAAQTRLAPAGGATSRPATSADQRGEASADSTAEPTVPDKESAVRGATHHPDAVDDEQKSDRLGHNDFRGRRSQAPPTAIFSERFEANTVGPNGKGALRGWRTKVSYDQRRFQLADGSWVRDFEIRLGLEAGSGVGGEDVASMRQHLRDAVDHHLNDRYELPGGDRLNVTVIFDSPNPHGTITVRGGAHVDQENFSVRAPSGALAHEILHYLGLPEGYRDPRSLLNRSVDPMGPMGQHFASGDWTLSAGQLAKIDEIAHHGPVQDLAHGAEPPMVQQREVLRYEPVEGHEPTPAPASETPKTAGESFEMTEQGAPVASPSLRVVTGVEALPVRSGEGQQPSSSSSQDTERLRVPGDGWCLLYSVVASTPPEHWPAALVGSSGDVRTQHAAVLEQIRRGETGLVDPGSPLGRAAEALHQVVLQMVRGTEPRDLRGDVTEPYRRSEAQMRLLAKELAGVTEEELRARLLSLEVDTVQWSDWLRPEKLREEYIRERTRELVEDAEGPRISEQAARGRAASEVELRRNRQGRLELSDNARGILSQFRYLRGRGVDLSLAVVDHVEGLRTAVVETMVRRPLTPEEHRRLIGALERWQPNTGAWNSDVGEMFPALVAHALGVRLRNRTTDGTQDVGPTDTGRSVDVYYNGRDHYDASQVQDRRAPTTSTPTRNGPEGVERPVRRSGPSEGKVRRPWDDGPPDLGAKPDPDRVATSKSVAESDLDPVTNPDPEPVAESESVRSDGGDGRRVWLPDSDPAGTRSDSRSVRSESEEELSAAEIEHIRRAIHRSLHGPDVEPGAGATRHHTPNGFGMWVASELRHAVLSPSFIEDVYPYQNEAFLRLVRSDLTTTDPTRPDTPVLVDLGDRLEKLKHSVDPGRGGLDVQQSYRVMRRNGWPIIDDALSAIAGVRDGFPLTPWRALEMAGLATGLAAGIAGPYSVPLVPRAYGRDIQFLYLSILGGTHAKVLTRLAGMLWQNQNVSFRVLRDYTKDTVAIWWVPTVPFIFPSFFPQLTENTSEPSHGEVTALPLTGLNKGYTSLATIFDVAGYFFLAYPRAITSALIATPWHYVASRFSQTSRDQRELSHGELPLPLRGDDGVVRGDLTHEDLSESIKAIKKDALVLKTAQRIFVEEYHAPTSPNLADQINHIAEDASRLSRLANDFQKPTIPRQSLVDQAKALLLDAVMALKPRLPQGQDVGAKAVYLGLHAFVHVSATLAAQKAEPGAAFTDYLATGVFVLTRALIELYDQETDARNAGQTFINFTSHELVALPSAFQSLQHPIWDTWEEARPWLIANIVVNATWAAPFGHLVAHVLLRAIQEAQQRYSKSPGEQPGEVGAAPWPATDPSGDDDPLVPGAFAGGQRLRPVLPTAGPLQPPPVVPPVVAGGGQLGTTVAQPHSTGDADESRPLKRPSGPDPTLPHAQPSEAATAPVHSDQQWFAASAELESELDTDSQLALQNTATTTAPAVITPVDSALAAEESDPDRVTRMPEDSDSEQWFDAVLHLEPDPEPGPTLKAKAEVSRAAVAGDQPVVVATTDQGVGFTRAWATSQYLTTHGSELDELAATVDSAVQAFGAEGMPSGYHPRREWESARSDTDPANSDPVESESVSGESESVRGVSNKAGPSTVALVDTPVAVPEASVHGPVQDLAHHAEPPMVESASSHEAHDSADSDDGPDVWFDAESGSLDGPFGDEVPEGTDLDHEYGPLVPPKRVKDEEADSEGFPRVNPVLYRLSELPREVLLGHTEAQWHYAVDADGDIRIGSEQLGQMLSDEELLDQYANYHNGARPEIGHPAVQEFRDRIDGQGHPTIAVEFTDSGTVANAAPSARVSGEIGWNDEAQRWEANDKSGRYMSEKVRSSPDPDDIQRWIGNVADRLSRRLGVPVTPTLLKHAPPTNPPAASGDLLGPEVGDAPQPEAMADPSSTGPIVSDEPPPAVADDAHATPDPSTPQPPSPRSESRASGSKNLNSKELNPDDSDSQDRGHAAGQSDWDSASNYRLEPSDSGAKLPTDHGRSSVGARDGLDDLDPSAVFSLPPWRTRSDGLAPRGSDGDAALRPSPVAEEFGSDWTRSEPAHISGVQLENGPTAATSQRIADTDDAPSTLPEHRDSAGSRAHDGGGERLEVPGDGWCLLYAVLASTPPAHWPAGLSEGSQDPRTQHQAILDELRGRGRADPRSPPRISSLETAAARLRGLVVQTVEAMTPHEVPTDAVRQWQWRPDALQQLGVELSADTNELLRARLNSLGLDSVQSADWLDPGQLRALYVQERARELADARGVPEQGMRGGADSEMRSMTGPAGLNRQFEYLRERRVDLPLDLADDPNRLRDAVTHEMLRREPLSAVEHQALITGLRNWWPGVAAWNTDAGEMFPALVAHTMGIRLHIRADGDSGDHGADDPRDVGLMATGHRVEVFYNGQDHYDASQLPEPSRVSSDDAVGTVGASSQLQEESASPSGVDAFNANRAASAPPSTEDPEGSVGPRVGDAHSSLTLEPEFVAPQEVPAEGRTATRTPSSFADLSQASQPKQLLVAASSDGHASTSDSPVQGAGSLTRPAPSEPRSAEDVVAVPQPELRTVSPPHPHPQPQPQLPARVGAGLVLGGMDVMEVFQSGAGGDEGLKHMEEVVRREAGAAAWEKNREQITALFADDSIRPKVPGMLRGGRTITHIVDLGLRGTLAIDLRLDGASETSKLHFKDQIGKYEFEHSSDSTTVVGSLTEGRSSYLAGIQGNTSHPNASDTATLLGSRDHQWAVNRQRADRQVSGGQTTEPGTRFHGNIQAVITHRLNSSPDPIDTHELRYRTEVVVPTRDVVDRSEQDDADEVRDTLGPLPSDSGLRPDARPEGPPRVLYSHALSGSDVVTNFRLLPDDGPPPLGGGRQRRSSAGPQVQAITDFVTSSAMKAKFEKAYGKQADQAMHATNKWLTVDLVQANLHGMTNKQPLVHEFEAIPGARLEVHAFVEPIGTTSDPRSANSGGDHRAPRSGRMMRPTGTTDATEFHYGTETDTSLVTQDVVTWSGQVPLPGRFRGQGGTDTGEVVGGLDGTAARGRTHNEAQNRQFRTRNTLKTLTKGQGWHGQVRLRVVMHAPGSVSPSRLDAPFRGAMHEARGRFDVLIEESETSPINNYAGQQVWAPPERIWGKPSAEHNSVANSPWWRLGVGQRTVQSPDSGQLPRPAYQPPAPTISRGAEVELRGLGSMDRVTNLDLSGLHGMLDSMGHRAFGGAWKGVRSNVSNWYHLNRVRGALPGMTQHSPLSRTELSGPGSSTKASLAADIEQLTFRRVIDPLSSPSFELTEGSESTITRNRQISEHAALGGRGGDVAGGSVLGEVIGGVSQTVRDGDRVRNQERVVAATKFDQPMAVFEGWVRLDATMTGSKSTVHESGLFPVEIAIPLTELQGSRTHDSRLPPTFTPDHPQGFVGLKPPSDPVGPKLQWTAPPRVKLPPRPPEHALKESWHPSDMLIGVDPASGLAEAIRQDLGPALGSGIDDAMTGVVAEFGPAVLPARLTHESGQEWSHDISVPGGSLTVKVRPIREAQYEYVGPSEKFESDLSLESQSSTAHLRGNVLRAVAGGRLQVPFPHGSATVQVIHSKSRRPNAIGTGGSDAGQLTDASSESTTADVDERIPARVKTVEPHDLFRQPIRFEISYERHLGAALLKGVPEAPQPVRLRGVFSYPRQTPTAIGAGLTAVRPHLAVDQVVVKIRPHATDAAPAVQGLAQAGRRSPGEDLVATHVLDSMTAQGVAAFGKMWPKVRAELAPHVKTMAIQRDLSERSRGGTTIINLKSVSGGKVVLGAHIDTMSRADSKATSEFYRGGQRIQTAGVSNTKASNWQGYVQVQGDVLPVGDAIPNLSVIGRVHGGIGRETINTHTESSTTGLLFRQKIGALNHIGTATVEAVMSRPGGVLRLGEVVSRRATGQVDFITRESPKDTKNTDRYVAGDLTAGGLSGDSIASKILDGPKFRFETLNSLRAKVSRLKMAQIKNDLTQALKDSRLAGKLPAMTRGEVEIFRHGSLRITGHAEVRALDFTEIKEEGGNANVLNEVNQTWVRHGDRSEEGGLRLWMGPHWRPSGFQGSLMLGGGGSGRQRFGASSAQAAKVSANSKFSRSYAIFDGTTRILLTVHDGDTQHVLPGVDVRGPIMIPKNETRRAT
jgi:hypothetical protein